jgi:S1-C subfamily serine protease
MGIGYRLSFLCTAGIISAKARSIGIINRLGVQFSRFRYNCNTAIESFIQTDAAIPEIVAVHL